MNYETWKWNDKIATGNTSLDHRHQSLMNIVNNLIEIYNSANGDPSPLLVEVPLDELFKFAAHHFADEESYLKSFSFPKLIEHHEEHIDFVITLINLKIRFEREENISKDLLDFLFEWRDQHIQKKDKAAMKVCQ